MEKPDWLTSLTPALAELERYAVWATDAFGFHVGQEPDRYQAESEGRVLPAPARVLVTIQTRGRKASELAHFWADKWTNEAGGVNEINLSAEDMKRPTLDVLASLHHELVHEWNWRHGIRDTAKSGRHNLRFKQAAEDFGLLVEKGSKSQGWAITTYGGATAKMVEDAFGPDEKVFDMARRAAILKERAPTKMKKWQCQCEPPFVVRCATNLDAECHICGQEFVKEGA